MMDNRMDNRTINRMGGYQNFINKVNNEELYEEEEEIISQSKEEDKISAVLKKIPVGEKNKKVLGPLVKEIKDNLACEIEEMAEQIVENRKKEEDEEMLISQRSNNNVVENDRIENARK